MAIDATTNKCHRIVIRLEALGGQFNPMDRLSVQPRIGAQLNRPYQRRKKKKHHTCKHVLMPGDPCWMCSQKLKCSRAELEKRRLSQLSSTPRTSCSKKVTAQTAANGWTSRRRLGETRNMANCFTLLQRITKLKCVNSAIRSKGQKSYLERYSRRGSRHLVEPTWVNTLAQNCHVEFWCGTHLTCKNTKNSMIRWIYIYIYINIYIKE